MGHSRIPKRLRLCPTKFGNAIIQRDFKVLLPLIPKVQNFAPLKELKLENCTLCPITKAYKNFVGTNIPLFVGNALSLSDEVWNGHFIYVILKYFWSSTTVVWFSQTVQKCGKIERFNFLGVTKPPKNAYFCTKNYFCKYKPKKKNGVTN